MFSADSLLLSADKDMQLTQFCTFNIDSILQNLQFELSQGTLTEWEGSVKMASMSLDQLLLMRQILFYFLQIKLT